MLMCLFNYPENKWRIFLFFFYGGEGEASDCLLAVERQKKPAEQTRKKVANRNIIQHLTARKSLQTGRLIPSVNESTIVVMSGGRDGGGGDGSDGGRLQRVIKFKKKT